MLWWSYWVWHPDAVIEPLHRQANLAVITLTSIIHILLYFGKANHEDGLSLSLCEITWFTVSLNNIVTFNWSALSYVLFLPAHSRVIVTDSRTCYNSGSYLTNCTRKTMIQNNLRFSVCTPLATASPYPATVYCFIMSVKLGIRLWGYNIWRMSDSVVLRP